jgi:hypothetical protein
MPVVSITLSLPEELKKDMDCFPDINWSAVAREAIRKRVVMMEKFKAFTKESELTESDALKLGREVSEKAFNKHKAAR